MKIDVFTLSGILDYHDKIDDVENKINAHYFRNNVFSEPLFCSNNLDAVHTAIANYEQMIGAEDIISYEDIDTRNTIAICKHYETIVNVYKIRRFTI